MRNIKFAAGLLLAGLTACTSNPAPSEAEVQLAVIKTSAALTAQISPTDTPPSPTATLAPTATPTPDYFTRGVVSANSINLRAGPGTLFSSIAVFNQGYKIFATGINPDGEWVRVLADAPDGSGRALEGWMYASLIDFSRPLDVLPTVNTNQAWAIQGKVIDSDNLPINGVRVAAVYTTDSGDEIWADATTRESGEFTILAPKNQVGPFDVQIVAVNCNSRIADAECLVREYYVLNFRTWVTLPQQQPVAFIYEQGLTTLTGKVVYQDGFGASQVLVKATRLEDGVESEWVTGVGGEFSLPLGQGTWEIYGIRFLPDGTPLFSQPTTMIITQAGQTLEPLIIPYNELSTDNAPEE